MFINPYETTACQFHKLDSLKKELELYFHDRLGSDVKGLSPGVYAVTDPAKDIPAFAHPIIMRGAKHGFHDDRVVFDARGVTRVNRNDWSVSISSPDEFALHNLRAALTSFVMKHDYSDLAGVGSFPLTVFVRWLSESIARRLSLQPVDQMRLSIITGLFYVSLFKEGEDAVFSKYDETSKVRLAQTIAGATLLRADEILQVIDEIQPMHSVGDYVGNLIEHGNSVRFENFSLPLLLTIVGASWFGFQSKEVIAVSLEHPPTFIAMVCCAMTQRSYKNTILSKVVERSNNKGAGDDYLKGLLRLPGVARNQD